MLNKTSISVFFLLLIGAPFFFIGGQNLELRSLEALWNLGHVLFFSLATWLGCLVFQYYRPESPILTSRIYIFLSVLILGTGIEGLQKNIVGRHALDIGDIFRNQLGCLIMLALVSSRMGQRKKSTVCLYQLFAVLLTSVALYPLSKAAIDELTALNQFPLLSDFETPFEVDRWEGNALLSIHKGVFRHGQHSLQVRLLTDTYSGASLASFPGNWQGFDSLFFSIYSCDDNLKLTCRIHDAKHNHKYSDRFNKRFILKKGWNDLMISLDDIEKAPVGRLMNMAKIKRIMFFSSRQKREHTIYIDHIYLKKE
ncbi:MAG: carbohydrate binding domain-containing protein [Candidatus Electrothrix communis]|nr:MAG: carbohydrate binding domain-containing protein [Candidatus Electrothrix communis]